MDIEHVAGFQWDEGNTEHCQKHGVSIEDIEEIFFNTPSVLGDPFVDEQRYRAIGRNYAQRFIYVVFTFRLVEMERYIRPISARYMHEKEIERYEKR